MPGSPPATICPHPNPPLRVGVVGLGRAGWDIHARMLRNDPRFIIAAAVDSDPVRCHQAESELLCNAYDTLPAMLRSQPLDLVVVASPSMCHLPHALAALEAGCHAIVEKPLGQDVEEVDQMIAAARAARRHLLPYQPRRLTPLHQKLRHTLRSGRLGRITHLAYRRYNYIRRDDWQCVLAYGGGMLSNHGSHALDQALDLIQSPVTQVVCRLDRIASAGDAEDHVALLLQAESGVTVHIEISDGAAISNPGPEWTIVGEYGALTATGSSGHIRYFNPAATTPRPLQRGLAANGRLYGTTEQLPWQHEPFSLDGVPDAPYYDFVHAAITEGEPFVFPPHQVRDVIALLDACRAQNPRFTRPAPGPSSPPVSARAPSAALRCG